MFIPKDRRDTVQALITQDGQALEIVPGSLTFEQADESGEYWFSNYHCKPVMNGEPTGLIVTLEAGSIIGYVSPEE